MPKRTLLTVSGQKYVVLPYGGFKTFGLSTTPSVPQVAVPFFDRVEDSVSEPLAMVRGLEENLKQSGVAGVGALIAAGRFADSTARAAKTHELSYEDKISFPFILFRGERREEFGILPTLYRPLAHTEPRRHLTLLRELARRELHLARKIRFALLKGRRIRLKTDQSRAAARHFGVASALVDFTFDPNVAAYFAHPRIQEDERASFDAGKAPLGIIYGFSYSQFGRCFTMQATTPGGFGSAAIDFILLENVIHVPYLAFDESKKSIQPAVCSIVLPQHFVHRTITLRCVIVPGLERIRAQQGMFLEIAGNVIDSYLDAVILWYVLDFICHKWCFLRTDAQFEVRPSVSDESLFPTESRLVRAAVWSRE